MKLLNSAKSAREDRAIERNKVLAATKIQSVARGFLARCTFNKVIRLDLDSILQIPVNTNDEYKPALRPALEFFHAVERFLMVFKEQKDMQRFEHICRYILNSMSAEVLNKNVYASVALSKESLIQWINQLKRLLLISLQYFNVLKCDRVKDMKMITAMLHFQITFTSCSTWKFLNNSKNGDQLKPGMEQLCKNCMGHITSNGLYSFLRTLLISGLCKSKPLLKPSMLTAIITIAIKPLMASEYSESLFVSFILEILSVPSLVHHIITMSAESLTLMMSQRIFSMTLTVLDERQNAKIIFHALEGNYALCLLANLIQLGNAEKEVMMTILMMMTTILMMMTMAMMMMLYVENKKSFLTHWHPILGWFAQKTDPNLNEAMPAVIKQISELWNIRMIHLLFEPLFTFALSIEPAATTPAATAAAATAATSFKISNNNDVVVAGSGFTGCNANLISDTCSACKVYMTSLSCLTQLKMEIMAGLCFQDILLPRLWTLITHLGPQCGLKVFIEVLSGHTSSTTVGPQHPLFNLLQLACDMARHVMTIVDEVEMYEQEYPFPMQMLMSISYFLNNFTYGSIASGYIDIKKAVSDELFVSTMSLLELLHSRDCRRKFAHDGHWLIKDIKCKEFLNDLSHNKPIPTFLLHHMPHIIPHRERVALFRKFVTKDKESLGVCNTPHSLAPASTVITVHRNRLVEDGYRQLGNLTSTALKGVIRVKFINEQGLDEAGIDQDGVFKEFLEETIRRVFDPSLNLFKATGEQKLYPSPTSYLQESHLLLFEFVGRVLGKAVYEGIVVDVPFASFFLSQLLGHTHSATYSSIDELPSLDPELYKNLTYIKHYQGDLSDLDLTFSYNEDILGKVVTHELIPGGKMVSVTNENKISYLHLMAHFKMRVIIKDQSNAFIRGFKSIVNSDWLSMFSGPELQKLISGDTDDIDLDDLRKNTHYYGGFHNNHKVIDWLWDILKRDFNAEERRSFLKFVTSCSKGPLLGFAYLEPPFSIRCVEVSEDQDVGDTVGSVLKGFFNIRKKDPVGRLPTSSTCFNLLKLPNYQKKSTLREKLRYSIASNTGFELS
ncbi:hypothetical protein HELRODRAFT_115562 [Helobdella robusta]|uniref:Ubiquitin-protein ligase E3B n=1 Tax=Helobdella robusta TaxID=6412 RepID=T1EG93_HELRO|nr:hypothetical protein HELRODRAFT_115562 [Helobdella robusta]ESN93513.1 hypothetical protein HELRODRAFT_115562 [Helobdella robusta]